MSTQETLLIIKPDGIAKGLVGAVLNDVAESGLVVTDSVRTHLSRKFVEDLYASERNESYYPDVVDWVSSAPVLLLKVCGEEAIAKVKWAIVGRYPDGIRGKHSENWIKNVAHAPDSESSSERELMLAEPIFRGGRIADIRLFTGKNVLALTGMSECGKSTVGKYLDSRGIPRLKIVKLFERVRDRQAPNREVYEFTKEAQQRDPYALWDAFIDELLTEMQERYAGTVSIESLYGGGFGPYLKRRMGYRFQLLYIDIPLEIRLQRQMQRENLTSIAEAEKLLLPRDRVKADSGIPALKQAADHIIDNSGTVDDLYRAINDIIIRSTT